MIHSKRHKKSVDYLNNHPDAFPALNAMIGDNIKFSKITDSVSKFGNPKDPENYFVEKYDEIYRKNSYNSLGRAQIYYPKISKKPVKYRLVLSVDNASFTVEYDFEADKIGINDDGMNLDRSNIFGDLQKRVESINETSTSSHMVTVTELMLPYLLK